MDGSWIRIWPGNMTMLLRRWMCLNVHCLIILSYCRNKNFFTKNNEDGYKADNNVIWICSLFIVITGQSLFQSDFFKKFQNKRWLILMAMRKTARWRAALWTFYKHQYCNDYHFNFNLRVLHSLERSQQRPSSLQLKLASRSWRRRRFSTVKLKRMYLIPT